jgi:polyisoprenoid-binding protein YceI
MIAMTSVVLAALVSVAASAPAKAAPTVTYAFGPATEIVYYVEHPMHHVKGVTKSLDGKVTFTGDKLAVPFTLSLPLISFNSGNANRDENAAHVLDVPHFPLATLAVTKFDEKSRTKTGATTHLVGTATGALSFKGVTHDVAVPVEIDVAADRLVVDGTINLKLTDYKVDRPSLFFTPIKDDVKVTVHGVGTPVTH